MSTHATAIARDVLKPFIEKGHCTADMIPWVASIVANHGEDMEPMLALRGMVGLVQLISHNPDVPQHVKEMLVCSHRYLEALRVIGEVPGMAKVVPMRRPA